MTPEEVLNSIEEGINSGDLDSLMTLYEADACFATQPGQLAKSPESVRQSLRAFIDLKGKIDLKVKRVLQASDLALVTTEWSFLYKIEIKLLLRIFTFKKMRKMIALSEPKYPRTVSAAY